MGNDPSPKMKQIRPEFLFYLINDLGFTRLESEDAWKQALKDFPDSELLTQEVVTRDILRGEYYKTS